jgi:hypothetical protein
MEVWCERSLDIVANTIRRFVAFNGVPLLVSNKRRDKVLVEMDLRRGLLVEVDIEWGDRSFTQKLDY